MPHSVRLLGWRWCAVRVSPEYCCAAVIRWMKLKVENMFRRLKSRSIHLHSMNFYLKIKGFRVSSLQRQQFTLSAFFAAVDALALSPDCISETSSDGQTWVPSLRERIALRFRAMKMLPQSLCKLWQANYLCGQETQTNFSHIPVLRFIRTFSSPKIKTALASLWLVGGFCESSKSADELRVF